MPFLFRLYINGILDACNVKSYYMLKLPLQSPVIKPPVVYTKVFLHMSTVNLLLRNKHMRLLNKSMTKSYALKMGVILKLPFIYSM